jgi:hypothetical protein
MRIFGDVRIGETVEIHTGASRWIKVVKIDADHGRREDGTVIGISFWTKAR